MSTVQFFVQSLTNINHQHRNNYLFSLSRAASSSMCLESYLRCVVEESSFNSSREPTDFKHQSSFNLTAYFLMRRTLMRSDLHFIQCDTSRRLSLLILFFAPIRKKYEYLNVFWWIARTVHTFSTMPFHYRPIFTKKNVLLSFFFFEKYSPLFFFSSFSHNFYNLYSSRRYIFISLQFVAP